MSNANTLCFRLSVVEIEFLQKLCKTMKPLSKALDILQSEKTSFIEYLLPTLYEMCFKLEKIQPMLHYCSPLVTALINGIHVRFENMHNKEIIAAAILIPHFKTEWTSERDAIEKGARFNSIVLVFLFLYLLFLEGCGQQLQTKLPHLSVHQHRLHFALTKSQTVRPRSQYIQVILCVVVQSAFSNSL